MKPYRFLLFGGMANHPEGGWHDLVTTSPTKQQAEANASDLLQEGTYVWYHIVDLETGTIIARGSLAKK